MAAVQAPLTQNAVNTTLNYYLDPAKGGHESMQLGTAGYFRLKYNEQPVQIHDLRGRENQFNLADNAFQHRRHVSSEKDFSDDDAIKNTYYKEIEQLLKEVTGASRVHVFSHMVRRSDKESLRASASKLEDSSTITAPPPATYVHVDQSEQGAYTVLNDNPVPKAPATLQNCRFAIINVWRPIKPIYKDPLAVCDARSVPESDFVPVTAYFPPKGSMQYAELSGGNSYEVYYAKANPQHRWYFVNNMQPDEVLCIKCYDSKKDGTVGRRAPHSAFSDPRTVGDKTRESVEVRTLCFWEDEAR
ncbi:hypothetical protein NA57DRAFT_59925 [Rhizodiscina lignyota]|uniref:Uncharacterized protein n=1 Tax=Rhizodiscina lignyota TaxID=1504668 RepID=A0A9P4M306_9PEZI|nr:hypothetical protein NA57DRAFT_59925 [Rhizodiscina lignyota]